MRAMAQKIKELFHDAGTIDHAARGRLVHVLDLSGRRIKIEVAGSFGKMHAEDFFLHWDQFGDLFCVLSEDKNMLFVKLKLKGCTTSLQWGKRVEEQHARQCKPKTNLANEFEVAEANSAMDCKEDSTH